MSKHDEKPNEPEELQEELSEEDLEDVAGGDGGFYQPLPLPPITFPEPSPTFPTEPIGPYEVK